MNFPYFSDQVNQFCWAHLGISGEELAKRFERGDDKLIENTPYHSIYQYKNTSFLYMVVESECGGSYGLKINHIWDGGPRGND